MSTARLRCGIGIAAVACLTVATGCSTMGPQSIPRDRQGYFLAETGTSAPAPVLTIGAN